MCSSLSTCIEYRKYHVKNFHLKKQHGKVQKSWEPPRQRVIEANIFRVPDSTSFTLDAGVPLAKLALSKDYPLNTVLDLPFQTTLVRKSGHSAFENTNVMPVGHISPLKCG